MLTIYSSGSKSPQVWQPGTEVPTTAKVASGPDRPTGVDARNWIPVSDKIGFVVMTAQMGMRTVDSEALLLASPEEGYFMVHRGNVWQRII